MIRRMRLTFITISMGALFILLLVIFVTINLFMEQITNRQIDGFLMNVIEHEGKIEFPEKVPVGPVPPGQPPTIEGCSFLLSPDMTTIEVLYSDLQISTKDLIAYAQEALEKDKITGEMNAYHYRMKELKEGYLFVFADASVQNKMLEQLLHLSYIISGISLVILFLILVILSKYVTRPVEIAFEKQKQFIADSSHELKTPLSIMSANLDILKMDFHNNKRVQALDESVQRMKDLIHDLLALARTEQGKTTFKSFNLSRVMENTILSLEVVAYERGKEIDFQIEPNIFLTGHEEDIRKMIGALMDNAIKYSRSNSVIEAKLYKKGNQKILEFYNEGEGVSKEEKEKLFDKFYRVDASRQRETGGYGLGLSIVKSIVDKHHGKIQVDSVPGEYIRFRIIFFR